MLFLFGDCGCGSCIHWRMHLLQAIRLLVKVTLLILFLRPFIISFLQQLLLLTLGEILLLSFVYFQLSYGEQRRWRWARSQLWGGRDRSKLNQWRLLLFFVIGVSLPRRRCLMMIELNSRISTYCSSEVQRGFYTATITNLARFISSSNCRHTTRI